jgi:hypothetical protein
MRLHWQINRSTDMRLHPLGRVLELRPFGISYGITSGEIRSSPGAKRFRNLFTFSNLSGERCGGRTHDLLIKSQLLYRLS